MPVTENQILPAPRKESWSPSANPSPRTLRALADTVAHLRLGCGERLVSVVRFFTPFHNHGILVVVTDEVEDLSIPLSITAAKVRRWIKPICLRRAELFQLSLPNPNAPETFSLSFWIREEGETLWGQDIRSEIPNCDCLGRLLAYHLESAVHYIRNRVILARLTEQDYVTLIAQLHRERILLMLTALLARGIWRLYPDEVIPRFSGCYPELGSNIREFGELYSKKAAVQKSDAYRAAWLLEIFVRGLRKYRS
jgi:hypothetical protein